MSSSPTVCSCTEALHKGDMFTILDFVDKDQNRYYVVLTSMGVKMFYYMLFEESVFFDRVSEEVMSA